MVISPLLSGGGSTHTVHRMSHRDSGVFKGYATMPWHTPLAPEAPVAG